MVRRLIVGLMASSFALTFWQAAQSTSANPPSTSPITIPSPDLNKPVDLPGLHNVVSYTNDLLCGGWPEGDLAFNSLSELGVKTIISVDGSMPDVETAKRHGLRYVHLPIGYNGMDQTRIAEIARAVRDLPKPIYLHCHHGKHRSASAAAAASVVLGWLTPQQALAKMKVSGTAENYTGLWDAVNAACTCDPGAVDKASAEFPEVWKPNDFVETMVEIDDAADNLKAIDKAGWVTPADHPDLVPAAVAGQLADHFRLVMDGTYATTQPKDFQDRLARDQKLISELEEAIVAKEPAAVLGAKLNVVIQSCKDCHASYRDKAEVQRRIFLPK